MRELVAILVTTLAAFAFFCFAHSVFTSMSVPCIIFTFLCSASACHSAKELVVLLYRS